MKRLRSQGRLVVFLCGCIISMLLTLATYPGSVAATTCATLISGQPGWLKNSNVKYFIDGPSFTSAESTQVRNAIRDWSYHNLTINCSNVYFSVDIGSPAFSISSNIGALQSDPDAVAATLNTVVGGVVAGASIVYFWGCTFSGGGNCWNRNGSTVYYNAVRKTMLHETGHTMGLDHPTSTEVPGRTVMNSAIGVNDSANNKPRKVQVLCDDSIVNTIAQYAGNCSPRPTSRTAVCESQGLSFNSSTNSCVAPSCSNPSFYFYDPEESECVCSNGFSQGSCAPGEIWNASTCSCLPNPDAPSNYCGSGASCNPSNAEIANCNGSWDCSSCQCQWGSPIVVDVQGNGFDLTSASNGVDFDLEGNGNIDRWAWTSLNSDDAWLALDRNGNNLVDNGKELFGNFTLQPPSPRPNGFLALAVFDEPANGGNGDGQIDRRDSVFSALRLWQDVNHNGVSEVAELRSMANLRLAVIALDYKESKKIDQNGNQFRYRAKVKDLRGGQAGRWAWDVFLVRVR